MGEGDRTCGGGALAKRPSIQVPRCPGNHLHHAIQRLVNIDVPDTNDAPTACMHIRIPSRVMAALGVRAVRPAIDFDDEPRTNAGEVCNVWSGGMLLSEAHAEGVS